METAHALAIFAGALLIGLALLYGAFYFVGVVLGKTFSPGVLLKGFRQKIWMTVGLGVFFFGCYTLTLFLSSFWITPETRFRIFTLLHEHVVAFIYLGLGFFSAISLSIYAIRLLIIYLYTRSH